MKYSIKFAFGMLALMVAGGVANATELRLSHQWSNKDVRHKVAEIVANEVAAANVDLEIKIFGSKSLFKPREQYKPLSRGQLDMTVFPLSYAGGQQPAFNLTLMPGLVKNHDHAARLNNSDFMAALEAKMAEDDVMVLVHGYLAGGFVGKDTDSSDRIEKFGSGNLHHIGIFFWNDCLIVGVFAFDQSTGHSDVTETKFCIGFIVFYHHILVNTLQYSFE